MKKIHYLILLTLLIGISDCVVSQSSNVSNSTPAFNSITSESILEKNREKFSVLKKYNLPLGKYAIGGSGPLGIRGIREINDIDILVSDDLRDELIKKYGIVDDGKTKKIAFPEGDIDAFWEGSFYTQKTEKNDPMVLEIISSAEVIEGLPFESLDNLIYFKRKMNRPKDLEDIKLIEKWKSTSK